RRVVMMAIGAALIGAASLLVAGTTVLPGAFGLLVAAAIAIGVGECFHTTALMPLVADLAPAALRGRYMATMGLSWWVGLALAPTVGTRLLAASPAAALLLAAGLAVAAGIGALALGRQLPAAVSRAPGRAAPAAVSS